MSDFEQMLMEPEDLEKLLLVIQDMEKFHQINSELGGLSLTNTLIGILVLVIIAAISFGIYFAYNATTGTKTKPVTSRRR